MESIKNRRDIKLVTTEGRRNHLVSIISNRNEKNKDTDKKNPDLFRSVNTGNE